MSKARIITLLVVLGFVCASLSHAADPAVELEYRFAVPEVARIDAEYHSVNVPDTAKYLEAVGLPLLPVRTAKILIPQGRDVKAINVAPGNKVTLAGEFKIEYGDYQSPAGIDPGQKAKQDENVYASGEPFPGNLFSVVSTQYLCGYKILILNLYPVQYIPALGKVSYYENMKVIVAHAPSGPPGIEKAKCRGLREDRTRVYRLVDNPSEVYSYTSEVSPSQETHGYVVITNDAIYGNSVKLPDLLNSRSNLYPCVKTVESIQDEYSGADLQQKIRNFIKYAYGSWQTRYVLLIGDADTGRRSKPIIPARGVYGKVVNISQTYIDTGIPCDMYYGALDDANGAYVSWDNDGDGIYGEGDAAAGGTGMAGEEADFFAEVIIGRIPADSPAEADNQIGKILAYENSIPLKSVLLVGRQLDDTPTWGGDYKDQVYTYFDSWSAEKLYERDGNYSPSALIYAMDSNAHSVVNYMSHSGYTNDMGLSNDQIAGLNNPTYFLAYSQGCMAGGFDYSGDDCAGEHFTVEDGVGGAFAYIGNTRYGWYRKGSIEGASQQFDREFFQAIFTESITEPGRNRIGVALQDAKEDLIGLVGATSAMRWCYFELCLLGDPVTTIYEGPIDTMPPAAAVTLTAGSPTSYSVTLSWIAPGDDGDSSGPVSQYDIRFSTSVIDEAAWSDATQCVNEPLPEDPGEPQSFIVTGLAPGTTYYFALKSADEVPNWSLISNTVTGVTTSNIADSEIYVSSLTMECKSSRSSIYAVATLNICKGSGSVVSGAKVNGHWGDATSDTDMGTTGADGRVELKSNSVKNAPVGTTFIFFVDDVQINGMTYVSQNNGDFNGDGRRGDIANSIIYGAAAAPQLDKERLTVLHNAFPNPGNPDIWIPFALSDAEHVVIRIYSITGQLVRTLDLGQQSPGAYITRDKAAYWDGRNEKGEKVSSGVYFYVMEAGDFVTAKKLIIAK